MPTSTKNFHPHVCCLLYFGFCCWCSCCRTLNAFVQLLSDTKTNDAFCFSAIISKNSMILCAISFQFNLIVALFFLSRFAAFCLISTRLLCFSLQSKWVVWMKKGKKPWVKCKYTFITSVCILLVSWTSIELLSFFRWAKRTRKLRLPLCYACKVIFALCAARSIQLTRLHSASISQWLFMERACSNKIKTNDKTIRIYIYGWQGHNLMEIYIVCWVCARERRKCLCATKSLYRLF